MTCSSVGARRSEPLEQRRLPLGRPHGEHPARAHPGVCRDEAVRGIQVGVGAVDEEARPVVDVEEDHVPRTFGRRPGEHVGDVRDVERRTRVPRHEPQGRGESEPGPVDERLLDLHDVEVANPAVLQYRPRREPQAEASDENAFRVLDEPERPLREEHLGARVDGVHREHAGDDELVDEPGLLPALAEGHLAPGGVSPGERAGEVHRAPSSLP